MTGLFVGHDTQQRRAGQMTRQSFRTKRKRLPSATFTASAHRFRATLYRSEHRLVFFRFMEADPEVAVSRSESGDEAAALLPAPPPGV